MKGRSFSKPKQKELDFEILVANLLSQKNKPIMVSLDRKSWRSSQYTRAGYFAIHLIKILNEKGLLNMKKGYYTPAESRKTRIWSSEELLNYFPILPHSVIYDPVELVELRDDNGKLKEYVDTAKTHRIRSILKQANEINQAAKVEYLRYTLSAHLIAIFKNKFTLYGRLHTKGHRHYQGFSDDERKQITINGDPVAELDFSGLHPRLLYAAEGKQFDDDPYSIVHDDPRARPFLKQILLCMVYAKNQVAAERAANYWLYKNHAERADLKEIGITRARPLIDSFTVAHGPISHYFCTGKETGLRIMNIDARIALDVVDHFAKQNKPILAVHDSFIVQSQYKKELRATMRRAYTQHTGGFTCLIK